MLMNLDGRKCYSIKFNKNKIENFPRVKEHQFFETCKFLQENNANSSLQNKMFKKSCNIPNKYICTWPTSYEFLEHNP